MKGNLNWLFLLLVAGQFSYGQTGRWQVGMKVGMGRTGVKQTRLSPYSIVSGRTEVFRPKVGVQFGVQLQYKLTEHLQVGSGVEYQTMKDQLWRGFLPDTNSKRWTTYSARRFQVPFTIQYRIVSRAQSVYVLVGAIPSYLLYLAADFEGFRKFVIDLDMPPRTQLPRRLARFQVPLVAGVGLPIGNKFRVELIYQYVNRPLEFLRYDPGSTTIGLTPEVSQLNHGTFLVASYWFGKST